MYVSHAETIIPLAAVLHLFGAPGCSDACSGEDPEDSCTMLQDMEVGLSQFCL